jgi:ActR/RegA family two-component response regulator
VLIDIQDPKSTTQPARDPRRLLLLLDADPVLYSLASAACDRHQWRVTVADERCTAWLPADGRRPKFLLLGFSLDDESSLQLLCDLHAMSPDAPVGVITGDAPGDVADVVAWAGGTAVVVKPCVEAEVAELM